MVFLAAFKQCAKEIKEVLYGERTIQEMITERRKFWSKNEQVKEIKNTSKTVETGALAIVDDPELKKDLADIQHIINELEGTPEKPGPASSVPLVNKAGTPLTNHSITQKKPLMVTVPIKHKDGRITYDSYKMGEDGILNKTYDRNEYKDVVVDDLFKKAIESAKEGTKVVMMTYKDEPLIISLNITHPHRGEEKFKHNLSEGLKRESSRIIYASTNSNGTVTPGTNLTKLQNDRLRQEKAKIESEMSDVNTNTKVSLQKNKNTLKAAIRKTKLEPIEAEIAKRATAKKGGFTAKKNNKTKKSTRRSS